MRTRIRKIGALAVGAGLLLNLAGCAREPSPPDRKPSIAFVLPSTQLNFTQEMAIGFRWGARQVGGVDFTVAGPPRLDNAREAKILQELIESNKAADGISLYAQVADLFAPVIARAHEKNIPMIAVNGRMDPSAKVELFVGND
jgi:ABC-type sugar transport system substrate-binding protein